MGSRRRREGPEEPDSPGRRQELPFHYRREERLSLQGAPQRRSGGFLRGNRALLIVLADIVLLVILGFIFLRFFGPPGQEQRLGPYRLTLRALRYGEVVYATVVVQRSGSPAEAAAGAGRVQLRLSLERGAPDSQSTFASAELPTKAGGEVVLRQSVPAPAAAKRLYAELTIDGRTVYLSTPLGS